MRKRLLIGAAFAAVLIAGWYTLQAQTPPSPPRVARKAPALAVDVAAVQEKAVPFLWHAVGQVEPFHSVAVRPQVTGVLQAVGFQEGERVKRGQLLFRIDPAPFAAAVAQAKAQLAKDEATLANARWQAARQKSLRGKKYASAQEYESAKALVAESRAAVALDQAALKQAEIQLGYCEIRAPIDGYTGALAVKAGNLLEASQSTPLVTINQTVPALVRFSAPQSELETVRASERAGDTLRVRLQAKTGQPLKGDLVFVNNAIDSKTGTIVLKARFANTDGALWPGQYVELDLVSGVDPHAVVIPETALQQGQNGPFVFLVADKRAKVQAVTAGRQVGKEVVIEKGLQAGAVVVSRVPRRLEDGSPVEPRPAG